MKWFIRLYKKAGNKTQLKRYLDDAYKEIHNGGNLFKNAVLFDRAYGLNLSTDNIYDLGWYIESGHYKFHFDPINVVKLRA